MPDITKYLLRFPLFLFRSLCRVVWMGMTALALTVVFFSTLATVGPQTNIMSAISSKDNVFNNSSKSINNLFNPDYNVVKKTVKVPKTITWELISEQLSAGTKQLSAGTKQLSAGTKQLSAGTKNDIEKEKTSSPSNEKFNRSSKSEHQSSSGKFTKIDATGSHSSKRERNINNNFKIRDDISNVAAPLLDVDDVLQSHVDKVCSKLLVYPFRLQTIYLLHLFIVEFRFFFCNVAYE